MKTSWQEAELFRPVERQPLVPQVVDALRRHIVIGELANYQRLPPIEKLARLFGVSVGTVHGALQVLSYLGIVRRQPGVGTFVIRAAVSHRGHSVALKRARVDELVALRRVIEVEAARRATRSNNRATADGLVRAYWELRSVRTGWPEDLLAADLAFHRAVVLHAGDPLLTALHVEVCARLQGRLLARAADWIGDTELHELHDQLASIVQQLQRIGPPRPASAASVARRIAELEQPRGP